MHDYQKEISGCGLVGIMNEKGKATDGREIIRAIDVMSFRSNGLGAGYAGYGIYPDFLDSYAFHMMFEGKEVKAYPADEKDMKEITPHLKEFCKLFGFKLEDILSKKFTKLAPYSHRPYGKLYSY